MHWSASIGPLARVGLVHLRGDPGASDIHGHSALQPWAGPALRAGLGAGTETFDISALGEAGIAVLSAEGLAEEVSSLKLAGIWLNASLNVGLRF
jgi:hypothetical protein